MELSLIPSTNRKRRGLVNRTLWETLRSTVFQGVLKKTGGNSLFSAVLQAARAQNNSHDQSAEARAARIVYGRLKRAPKLPSKPALQSSESSTDDLSGSEDSSSSGLDDAENDQKNEKETVSKVSILSGHGTEDDDNENENATSKGNSNKNATSGNSGGGTKSGELSIEIKLGKDNEKSKTLLTGNSFRALASSIVASKANSSNTGTDIHNIIDRPHYINMQ